MNIQITSIPLLNTGSYIPSNSVYSNSVSYLSPLPTLDIPISSNIYSANGNQIPWNADFSVINSNPYVMASVSQNYNTQTISSPAITTLGSSTATAPLPRPN